MADEFWDEIQNLELGQEDPALFIPHEAYVMVEATNRLSLIDRPRNPRVQNLNSVIAVLPRVWGLTIRIHERILDATYVQFLFQNEVDMLSVHRREPWIFNNWFVASTRWEPAPAINFVTTIDLWVQMRGIPLIYVCKETAMEIAQDLGEIIHLDFQEATTTQIAYIRVRVRFGINDRLMFFQRVIFDSGETVTIRFQYERLKRICSSCFRITHNRDYCPYRQRHHSIARERAMFRDTVMRSSMNSQSQLTENSFPAPVTPLPRVATPPVNHDELRAAMSCFVSTRRLHRHHHYSDSNRYLVANDRTNQEGRSSFEVGESSTRHEDCELRQREETARQFNQQERAQRMRGATFEELQLNWV
ncbi:hypothetical protein AXX17_AT5G21950 [Arabidopsis thaliana]|uniref:Ta11-like non-LTR retrotransposon n=1 Tax=Arabidopsis thaliana TaxID=3702 RepID=A0A178UMU0_ARATH|nr:hypothetical protein AXX17_AT5G21950 [Arabidopsis thaliana]